jgi:hypothetical protein
MVTWDAAETFCRKLGELAGEQSGHGDYRLPTEAEWEYACRAGTATRWCSGDDPAGLKEFAWFAANAGKTTHPVRQKTPNAWGLYDMHGNVWEWCQDWCGDGFYAASPTDDPAGPPAGSSRIHRGGALAYDAWYCRASYRFWWNGAQHHGDRLGFRVARSVPSAVGGTAVPRESSVRAPQASTPGTSTVIDPEGNLDGDKSRRFMDITKASIDRKEGQLVFTVDVAAPFPGPHDFGDDRRVDFIFRVDFDMQPQWSVSQKGNSCGVRLSLVGGRPARWRASLHPHEGFSGTMPRALTRGETVEAKGNTVSLALPEGYWPDRPFAWWVQSSSAFAKDWPPKTENPPTPRAVFTPPAAHARAPT